MKTWHFLLMAGMGAAGWFSYQQFVLRPAGIRDALRNLETNSLAAAGTNFIKAGFKNFGAYLLNFAKTGDEFSMPPGISKASIVAEHGILTRDYGLVFDI